ncbi:MAG: DUF3300 domain-containing protein [Acetobacteraceae bacterium]|nr:DUF3300 domain-containing protein [Acetobacteraceae bacterium]
MKWSKYSMALLVSSSLVLANAQAGYAADADASMAQPGDQPGQAEPPTAEPMASVGDQSPAMAAAPTSGAAMPTVLGPSGAADPAAQSSAEALNQLVAPIALYPDAMVAQILAASAFPVEIVQADRWLQQEGGGLQGDALAQAVDGQPWDPSVKALIQFPAILANMDRNLGWTTALGNAHAERPQAVLAAVQVMRQRAQQAGTLQTTPEETVTTDGSTVMIEPADPNLVYMPEYDPWLAYGAPVPAYPDWDPYPGLFLAGPGAWFGVGIGLGIFAAYGWGWHHWGADWHHGGLVYNHAPYVFHGRPFGRPGYAYGGPPPVPPAYGFRGGMGYGVHPGGIGVGRSYAFRGNPGFVGGFRPGPPMGGFAAGGFRPGLPAAGFHPGGFHGGGGGGHR